MTATQKIEVSAKVDPEVQARLELAVRGAKQAGGSTLKWFRQTATELSVERKGDDSPVTVADRAAEVMLRELITASFPGDAILGEEYGDTPGTTSYRWILDPIDGTKSFIAGVPLYTTLVAVMKDGEPLIGVIYAPATGEIVYAARGGEAWYAIGDDEPVRARVSSVEKLSEATFVTTQVEKFERLGEPGILEIYNHLEKKCRLTRTWGDGYGFLLVATGRADIMVDLYIKLWDAAALLPVIEGAGGHYTDWQGEGSVYTGTAIATNGAFGGEVLRLTKPWVIPQ